jgi:hypothetical protein
MIRCAVALHVSMRSESDTSFFITRVHQRYFDRRVLVGLVYDTANRPEGRLRRVP